MDKTTQLGIVLLMVIVFIIIICFVILGVMKAKEKRKNKDKKRTEEQEEKSTIQQNYSEQSIFNFMEFDKIEDNMIIQNKGKKFLMVVKCQGVNYDLMSGVEKASVEQGFLQYLNALRYQIQIYVQTRTVDLESSISTYKDKIKLLGNNLVQKELLYNQHVKDGIYPQDKLMEEKREVAKIRNLYEYGVDIVNNTERMSLNKGILSKQYYIIIPYYAEEIGTADYSKDEIQNMAFSELYTRAQSTISLLSVCGVMGQILDSVEISNLLYMAYNRDEAEVYDLRKAIAARYDEMYTTAPDVIAKKIKELDKQIEKEAYERANDAVLEVRQENEKERMLKQKEEQYEDAIKKLAKIIIERNKNNIGTNTAERAKAKIDNKEEVKKEKEVEQNEKEQKTVRRGRPRKG